MSTAWLFPSATLTRCASSMVNRPGRPCEEPVHLHGAAPASCPFSARCSARGYAPGGPLDGENGSMDQMLTVQQAFDAMRLFLAEFNEREPVERRLTIEQLLRWT